MRVLVPFASGDPKTRLDPILSDAERHAFACASLQDVIAAVRDAGGEPSILATESIDDPPAPVIVDERPLSPAVNEQLMPPMAVVMADVTLATSTALKRVFDTPGDLVLVPGRGGGTNVIVVRSVGFHVDFHGISITDHRSIAEEQGLTPTELDSYRLSTDIDEPADLVEVLLHSDGHAATWLREHGFRAVATEDRVTIARE